MISDHSHGLTSGPLACETREGNQACSKQQVVANKVLAMVAVTNAPGLDGILAYADQELPALVEADAAEMMQGAFR